jgi:hypothetical protein
MNLLPHRFAAVPRALAGLLVSLAAFLVPPTAHADQNAAQSPVIGKTTLAEARELWAAGDARIVSEGHLAIGGGSGTDGHSQVGLEQVLLVTVEGVDFEALPTARYAFVDNVLYATSAQLHNKTAKIYSPFKELSDDDMAQLLQTLTKKYGKPRGLRDIVADKKPNVFIWDLRDNELVLNISMLYGYHLTLKNKALEKKVEAYSKIECKKHRQDAGGSVYKICV